MCIYSPRIELNPIELSISPSMSMESEEFGFVWKWRKYLLLLATLVVSATYVAGLSPPGGMYTDNFEGHFVGDPVLAFVDHRRYAVFFYCNAAAFLSSLTIVMILLDQRIVGCSVGFAVLRFFMLLDLLALMGAFAAGSFRDVRASIYVPAAFITLLAYVAIHIHLLADGSEASELDLKGRSKVPLLLASFATPLTYGAGLVPPGGAWFDNGDGNVVGDPIRADVKPRRYLAFSYCNATCFVSSLAIITLLVSKRTLSGRIARSYALQVCVLVDLLGLMGAYAAGSCRTVRLTAYSVSLAGAVLLYIGLVVIFCMDTTKKWLLQRHRSSSSVEQESPHEERDAPEGDSDIAEGSWSLLLLLGTFTAAVTYQAGLNPPGGFWGDETSDIYMPGHPVLLDLLPRRYNALSCTSSTVLLDLLLDLLPPSSLN